MSWNRPSGAPKATPKKPSAMRGIIAGGVIVLAACAALFFLFSGGDDSPAQSTRHKARGTIREATPVAAPKEKESVPVLPKEEIRKLPDGRLMKYIDGKEAWMFPRKPPTPHIITNGVDETSQIETRIFKQEAHRHIAFLLTTEPGAAMIGDAADYYRNFNQDFEKALNEPILLSDDDTPEERELKLAVKEVKEELRKRRADGEDLFEVMCKARDEMQELGLYKEDLRRQVDNILETKEDLTKADMNDLLDAANKMLEERGSSKLSMPSMMEFRLKMMELEHDNQTERNESNE